MDKTSTGSGTDAVLALEFQAAQKFRMPVLVDVFQLSQLNPLRPRVKKRSGSGALT